LCEQIPVEPDEGVIGAAQRVQADQLSIKARKIVPSTLLRRLGSNSRKNFAFRELGRVIRTVFLLRYLGDPQLRATIHAATNKSEQFNDFAQWSFFGNKG